MYSCKVYHEGQEPLFQGEYRTLTNIADALGMTYQQVADLSSRRTLKKYQTFKFFPKIEIKRIKNKSTENQ